MDKKLAKNLQCFEIISNFALEKMVHFLHVTNTYLKRL